MQHAEHNVLYAQDPLMQGFHSRHISHMLDIVCENQGQTGFTVAEVGAGTGGFTRQVIHPFNASIAWKHSPREQSQDLIWNVCCHGQEQKYELY